jgi:hypothetical protein
MAECRQEGCKHYATHVWYGEGRFAEVQLCDFDWTRLLNKAAPYPTGPIWVTLPLRQLYMT